MNSYTTQIHRILNDVKGSIFFYYYYFFSIMIKLGNSSNQRKPIKITYVSYAKQPKKQHTFLRKL